MSSVLTGPYDNAEYVLNLTRSVLNDAALSIAGNVFADGQPYVFPLLNAAYRDLQDMLVDGGVETFIQTTQLLLLPVVDPIDPGTQIQISYVGFFDGSNNFPNPTLPPNMIIPLRFWERQSGTTNYFAPMFQVNDGLPSVYQTPCLRYWDWQSDKVYMPGATQVNDVQLRYLAYLPDLTDGTSPVLILRCAQALAYLTAYQFATSRGSSLAPQLQANAKAQVDDMINRTAKRSNRGNHRRRGYGAQARSGGIGMGWAQW
jgi:hypothetical protein